MTPFDENDPKAWYQAARFGMFIHWGAYSTAGVEASWSLMAPELSEAMFGTTTRISEKDYMQLPARFNPVDFDAEAWVRTAQQAGMRYMVITAKHHDGFCMFDAPGTDYKITKTAFGRDVCQELAQACAKAGMRLGFYYSPPDMHHPGYRDTRKPVVDTWTGQPERKEWASYLDYMESHLRKLLTDYGPVSVIWFDGLTNMGKYDPARFHNLIHNLSPQTLINDRLGAGFDFVTPEQSIPKTGIPVHTGKPPAGMDPGGDGFFRLVCALIRVPLIGGLLMKQVRKYQNGGLELAPVLQTPYPAPQDFQPWETCMTSGTSWGYNPQESTWKTTQELLQNLVRAASGGGNYLLNVGPTGAGVFPPQAIELLQVIGQWMRTYGETIYGSTYTPLRNQPWGEATRKGSRLYLHIFHWPAGGKLSIPNLPVNAQAIHLLGVGPGSSLNFSQNGPALEVSLPAAAPDANVSVLAVDFNEPAEGLAAYSPAPQAKIDARQFMRTRAKNNLLINAFLNALIAVASFRLRTHIPFAEAVVDELITVAIITWLVGWIGIGVARSEIIKGNLFTPAKILPGIRLPHGTGSRALVLMLFMVCAFGGLILANLLFLLAPAGISGWGYIVFKTLYTGICAALASALAVQSVFNE